MSIATCLPAVGLKTHVLFPAMLVAIVKCTRLPVDFMFSIA